MSLLELKNISKAYRDGSSELKVLNDLKLKLDDSEICIIMGPSGSGKTTLLNIAGTLDSPNDGIVKINGSRLDYQNQDQIDSIRSKFLGILFQTHNLLPEFTIKENIEMPHRLIDSKVHLDSEVLLKSFGLISKKNSFPSELSAGELQRISLLRASVNKPKLIIADEPTANLDKDNLLLMIDFIKKINKEHRTAFLIATHDERLCDIADKILYLDNRKLVKRDF